VKVWDDAVYDYYFDEFHHNFIIKAILYDNILLFLGRSEK